MPRPFATTALVHGQRTGQHRVPRPTVGFLTDSFSDYYQLGVLAGAVRAARDHQANFIAFASGVPTTPQPEDLLPGPESVDGLVVTAPTMAYGIGIRGVAEYCRNIGALPICFVGARAPGIPAVVPENRGGIELAVRHLVRVHGKQRIAFLGGIPGNPEAEERLDAFRVAMRANDQEPNDDLITAGDFMRHPGANAIRRMLARGTVPDAIVTANDMMAFGAIDALREAGLDVPRDVAVIGFDDVEEGHFSVPTLSSVRQPLDQLGAEATRQVLGAIAGGAPASETGVRLSLIQRASCGCEMVGSSLGVTRPPRDDEVFETVFARRRLLILAELSRAGQAALGRVTVAWPETVLDAFADDVRGVRPGAFLATLQTEVARTRASGAEVMLWQRIIDILHEQALACMPCNDVRRAGAEGLLHRALERVAREMRDAQAMRRMNVERWMRALRESGIALARVPDTDTLLPVLTDHLDRLGCSRAYLAIRESATTSRLLLGYDQSAGAAPVSPCPSFPTRELAPLALRTATEPRLWVAIPLQLGERRLGHVLLDHGVGEGLVWEGIAEQLTIALEICRLAALAA